MQKDSDIIEVCEREDIDFKYAGDLISGKIKECRKRGVFICSKDPNEFMECFLAAAFLGVPVFLGNPNWKENEWEQVFEQVSPALIFGDAPVFPELSDVMARDLKPFCEHIMIPTGGTGGKVKFAMHTWESLANSAEATADFFNIGKGEMKSYCLLPLYHISGLIQVVRMAFLEGEIIFPSLGEDIFGKQNYEGYCLSLVPTQLERFMQDPKYLEILRTFDVIFLGGAAADFYLLDRAREEGLRLAPVYGMTETGSMVAAIRPEDFLAGEEGFQELPHVKISINEDNLIVVRGDSLFSGYFPSRPMGKSVWVTDDVGFIDDEGHLFVLGRADRIIVTGGEKVDPNEVEREIMATGLVRSAFVFGRQDAEWGQRVVAVCLSLNKGEDYSDQIKEKLKEKLVNYKIPKDWLMLDELPIDEKGKLNENALRDLWEQYHALVQTTSE